MNDESAPMDLFDAVTIAAEAHQTARPRDDGPYIAHPVRVMLRVVGDHARMTALLHDVVEDHAEEGWTFEELDRRGCPAEVLEALRLLTHEKPRGDRDDPVHVQRVKDDYAAYIERLASNSIARSVKLADLADNIGDGIVPEDADTWTRGRLERYLAARERLNRKETR